jgi:hypothetical protein
MVALETFTSASRAASAPSIGAASRQTIASNAQSGFFHASQFFIRTTSAYWKLGIALYAKIIP